MSIVNLNFMESAVIMADERENVKNEIFCAIADVDACEEALPDSRWEHIVRCVLRYVDAEQDLRIGEDDYYEETEP